MYTALSCNLKPAEWKPASRPSTLSRSSPRSAPPETAAPDAPAPRAAPACAPGQTSATASGPVRGPAQTSVRWQFRKTKRRSPPPGPWEDLRATAYLKGIKEGHCVSRPDVGAADTPVRQG